MRTSEWIIVSYFSYLIAAAAFARLPTRRRLQITAAALTALVLTVVLARTAAVDPPTLLRDWNPALQLLAGYWISGLFFGLPSERAEAWLLQLDRSLFRTLHLDRLIPRSPRLVIEYFETAYLSCYAMVPAGLATLYAFGLRSEADWFWTVVLPAAYACYGMLPWLQTRPPRVLESTQAIDGRPVAARRLNLLILGHASIHANTVPSGHAAGALATALAVGDALPQVGAILLLVALSIAIGSVIGRYHYAADAVSGIFVALLSWAVVRALWSL